MRIKTEVRGGEKLTKKLKQIQDRLTQRKKVLIGLPVSTGNYDDGAPVAVIGAVHEFGSADGHIPERSFLRVPLRQNADNIRKAFSSLSKRVVNGEITAFQMLDQIGARAVGYCQEAIETGIAPPNAPSTIKRKDSATPLIDKGILRSKITHIVED